MGLRLGKKLLIRRVYSLRWGMGHGGGIYILKRVQNGDVSLDRKEQQCAFYPMQAPCTE